MTALPALLASPGALPLAAGLAQQSAPVTNWPGRLLSLAVVVAVILGAFALMRAGWRRRGRGQSALAEPHALPDPLPGSAGAPPPGAPAPLVGRYYASTTAGDWLDRVVVHGLGTRSACRVELRADGLAVEREGARGFLVPTADLLGARLEKGIAGKVTEAGGLLVVTWVLGSGAGGHDAVALDSGFRSQRPDEHVAWVEAITALVDARPAPASTPGGPAATTPTVDTPTDETPMRRDQS